MKISWKGWVAIIAGVILIFIVAKGGAAYTSGIKHRTYGPETMQFPFTLNPGESMLQKVHRTYEEGEESERLQFMRFNISFDKDSKGAYIVYSQEGRSAAFGSDILNGDKFVIGENPFHIIPGVGHENWDTYYIRMSNEGNKPVSGTITLIGNRRTVFDPKTGIETPMKYH